MTDANNEDSALSVSWQIAMRQLDEAETRCAEADAAQEHAIDVLWNVEEAILATGAIEEKLRVLVRRHGIGLDGLADCQEVIAAV